MTRKLAAAVLAIAFLAVGCGGGSSAPRTLLGQAVEKCEWVDFTGAYEGEEYVDHWGNKAVDILVIRPSNTVSMVGGKTEAVSLAKAHYSNSVGWVISCLARR